MRNLLDTGCSIALNPGGIREMVANRSDKELVLVQRNLGFFKFCITHHNINHIIPIYAFGAYPSSFIPS